MKKEETKAPALFTHSDKNKDGTYTAHYDDKTTTLFKVVKTVSFGKISVEKIKIK